MSRDYRQIVANYHEGSEEAPLSLTVHFSGWERCDKGHTFGPASRSHYLLHFVVGGQGTFYKEDQSYPVYPGNGFLITPFEITTYSADRTHPWEYYWVGFSGTDAEKLLSRFGMDAASPIFSFSVPDILQPLRELVQNKPHPGRDYLLLASFYRVFAVLAMQPAEQSGMQDARQYIAKAMDFIKDNYVYDITVDKIAAYIGLHRSYLYKLFKDHIGVSVQQYLLDWRLQQASSLLLCTRYSVSQVCYSCGFKDPDHFSKIFKQKMHLSPTDFRIMHQN